MYTVKIRNHIMIAHSLPNPYFGPAQNMHGATYIVDAIFSSKELNQFNVVLDIGMAHEMLKEVLSDLGYKNLDEHPEMQGVLTTTEYLAKYIHDKLKEKCVGVFSGSLEIILGESHEAWAGYKG